MRFEFKIIWCPENISEFIKSINDFIKDFGFMEELKVYYTIGTQILEISNVEDKNAITTILELYEKEAVKLFQEKLGGKIKLERILKNES